MIIMLSFPAITGNSSEMMFSLGSDRFNFARQLSEVELAA